MAPSPYSITTDRLVLRAYERSDVLDVHQAVEANAHRLQAFMWWDHEEQESLALRHLRLSRFRREFDEGRGTNYGVFKRTNGEFIGGFSQATRGNPFRLEIGYWVTEEAEGRWYASEATLALTLVSLEYRGAQRVEIHCDPNNERSRATAQRVGFTWHEHKDWEPADGLPERDCTEVWVASEEHLKLGPLASAPRPILTDASGTVLNWSRPR